MALKAVLVGLLSLGAVTQGSNMSPKVPCDSSEEDRRRITENAVHALRADGRFYVLQGNFSFNQKAIGNPVGKYGTVRFPDRDYPYLFCNQSGSAHGGPPIKLCDLSWVMGPKDAVVWLGCTPPPAKYFSMRSYIAFRFTPSFHFPAVEPSDPINHLLFNTTARPGEDPFCKTSLVVTAGDEETARAVIDAFTNGGLPSSAVNLDVMPVDMARYRNRNKFWATDKSDGFAWQFRVSEVEDQGLGAAYLNQVWPAFLVRAKRSYERQPAKPLERTPLRPRGAGRDQSDFVAPLAELEERVVAFYSRKGAKLAQRYPLVHNLPDLEKCLADPQYFPIFKPTPEWNFPGLPSCDWFTRALYTLMDNDNVDPLTLNFPVNRVFVALGINQPAVGRCSFSNLMVSAIAHFEEPQHSANLTSTDLMGTVSEFAPEVDKADSLFVYSFGRSCLADGPACRVLTTQNVNETEYVYWAERKYLEPTTKIGPAPEELLPPVVLAFDFPAETQLPEITTGMEAEAVTQLRRRS